MDAIELSVSAAFYGVDQQKNHFPLPCPADLFCRESYINGAALTETPILHIMKTRICVMDFFNKALIPDSDAKFIIASAEIGNIKPAILRSVDEKVRQHSDLSVCHLGGRQICHRGQRF